MNVCQAAELNLPPAVRNALDRELDNYRVRSAVETVYEGKTAYLVTAQGRTERRLRMTIGENGELWKKVYECQFSVIDNRLMREESPFRIASIYTPEAGDDQTAPKTFIESISKISYAGGNLLAFDLYGLNPDGKGFSKEADAFYQKMIDRLLYMKLNGFCRVFGAAASKDSAMRLNAIRTVADYFKKENEFLFWIDGPDAASLAKAFKKIAPDLVVAAPGGDIEVVDAYPNEAPEKPVIVIGPTPSQKPANLHFLLKDTPENLKIFDQWNADPEEQNPVKPDNSLLSEQERQEGFVSLFDGATTKGWLPLSNGRLGFIAKDGLLQRTPGGGSIRTVERFDNFVLRLEYRIVQNGNSGVQVHCPRSNRASKVGFEVQIMGDYGDKPSKSSTGSIYYEIPPQVNANKPAGEWNSMEITCNGLRVKVILNGQTAQDLNFDDYDELKYRLRDGFIILTDHGADVSYRNIRIKKL